MGEIVNLPEGEGIGPAPEHITDADVRKAWDDLVDLVSRENPGFLIRMDMFWMKPTAYTLAFVRTRENCRSDEYISCLCAWLKGLNLGPDSLQKLGLECEWKLPPDE